MPPPLYLDYNATTPMDPSVLEAMLPFFLEKYGNASSNTHVFGWAANTAVEIARKRVAKLINANETEIIFCSGATEACNMAINGILESYSAKGNHIITCQTEHKAVYDTYKYYEKRGVRVTYIPVNIDGLIDLQALKAAISNDTILVSVMYANNETGVIQPISVISTLLKEKNIPFMCDATQAIGKIPVDVQADGIDLLACSAHKLYGPKGIGALYVRRRNPRIRLTALLHGGSQERNLRAGTLNVPAIVGFGKAAELCYNEMEQENARLLALRKKLEQALLQLPNTKLNGHAIYRLPQTTNIDFSINSSLLMRDLPHIALSTGSACSSGTTDPSHVLMAMTLDKERALSSLRISFGRFTSAEDITFAIQEIEKTVLNLHNSKLEQTTKRA